MFHSIVCLVELTVIWKPNHWLLVSVHLLHQTENVYVILNPISTMRRGFRPPPFKLFYIAQKLAKLVSRNFVTFPKMYLATCISEPFRGQGLAAGTLKKLKALDTLIIIYHWKVFSSLILRKDIKNCNYLI